MQIGAGHKGADIYGTKREREGGAFALKGRMKTRRGQIPVEYCVRECVSVKIGKI